MKLGCQFPSSHVARRAVDDQDAKLLQDVKRKEEEISEVPDSFLMRSP